MSNLSVEDSIKEVVNHPSFGSNGGAGVSMFQHLPYSDIEILEGFMKLVSNPSGGNVKHFKIRTALTDYIIFSGGRIATEEEMLAALQVITDNSEEGESPFLSWFVTSVVMNNKLLPLSAFVALTAQTEVGAALGNLRSEFWNSHNGEVLREKYFKVWLENTDEGKNLAGMPETYSYRVWFQLAVPDELKSLMPPDFSDRRLRQE